MSNYIVTDSELTSVANAIRTKGGTNGSLVFPGGFTSAISNISGGGGGSSDFSTAEVTFVNNTADKVLAGTIAAIVDGEVSGVFGMDGLADSISFDVVLYKGLNVIVCSNRYQFTVTTSGKVNYDSEEGLFYITGDCTITIS